MAYKTPKYHRLLFFNMLCFAETHRIFSNLPLSFSLLLLFFFYRDRIKKRSSYCLGRERAVSGRVCYTDLRLTTVSQIVAQSGMQRISGFKMALYDR